MNLRWRMITFLPADVFAAKSGSKPTGQHRTRTHAHVRSADVILARRPPYGSNFLQATSVGQALAAPRPHSDHQTIPVVPFVPPVGHPWGRLMTILLWLYSLARSTRRINQSLRQHRIPLPTKRLIGGMPRTSRIEPHVQSGKPCAPDGVALSIERR